MDTAEFIQMLIEEGATKKEATILAVISWIRNHYNPDVRIVNNQGPRYDIVGAFQVYQDAHPNTEQGNLRSQMRQAIAILREDMQWWENLPLMFGQDRAAIDQLQWAHEVPPVVFKSLNPPVEHPYSDELIALIEKLSVIDWGWDRPLNLNRVVVQDQGGRFDRIYNLWQVVKTGAAGPDNPNAIPTQGLIIKYRSINRWVREHADIISLQFSKKKTGVFGVPWWMILLSLVGAGGTVYIIARDRKGGRR